MALLAARSLTSFAFFLRRHGGSPAPDIACYFLAELEDDQTGGTGAGRATGGVSRGILFAGYV